MMEINKLLTEYSNELNPTAAAEERVAKLVFNELSIMKKRSIFSLSSLFKAAVIGAPLFGILVALVLVPALFSYSADPGFETVPSYSGNANVDKNESKSAIGVQEDIQLEGDMMTDEPLLYPPQERPEDTETPESQRAKEQTARLTVETEDINSSFESVRSLVARYNGYVNSSYIEGGSSKIAYINMRVPADKFDLVLEKLRDLDLDVVGESISSIDKQSELTEVLKIKSKLTEDVKELEQQLKVEKTNGIRIQLQQELDLLKGDQEFNEQRLRDIKAETLFSTIEVSLRQKKLASLLSSISEAFKSALSFWAQVFLWILIPFVFTLPILVIIVIAYRLLKRKR